MKALVVGGTGFLGMNVVRTLVAAGHDVAATRRVRANTLFARKLGARLVVAELDDEDTLTDVMRGRDVVFMCAAHYPRYSIGKDEQIATARRRVAASLSAAKRAGVERFVLTSSVATVGPPAPPRSLSCEEDLPSEKALRSVYFATKCAIEEEAAKAAQDGLDVVTLCPTGVVGELDVKAGTGFFLLGLASGKLRFFVDGRTNLVDAATVGLAHLRAAERGRSNGKYIIGGHNVTIGQLFEEAGSLLSISTLPRRLPLFLAEPLSSFDEWRCARRDPPGRPFIPREFIDMARHGRWVDTSRATQDLGLGVPPTLKEMLRVAIAWYAKFRYITHPAARDLSLAPAPAPEFVSPPKAADAAASFGGKA